MTLFKSLAALFVLAVMVSADVQAQDDARFNKPPFVDAIPPAGRPAVAPKLLEPEPAAEKVPSAKDIAPDPQVIQLNELARRGEIQLADAINSFTRIKLWSDADRWLTTGVAPVNDQEMLAEMAKRIGADNLFRLSSQDEISAGGKAAVAKMSRAMRAQAESTDRILAAIDGLDDPSVDQRLESARRLLAGGRVSVAELVKAAVAEKPTAPRPEILRAMLRIGGAGELAIGQLAIYGNKTVRPNALRALTQISRQLAVSDLVTALHATDTTNAEVALATSQLPLIVDTVPGRDEAIAFLYSELIRLRQVAAEIDNDFQRQPLWSVNPDLQSVTSNYALAILLAYRDAYDAGSRLRRIGAIPPAAVDATLAADLGYRVMIDPDWGRPEEKKLIRDKFGSDVGAAGLSKAINWSLEKNDQPALVGLLRMVDRDLEFGRTALLMSSSPNLSPIVRAAMHSQPWVRYEAALAITRLDPPPSYAGSSHVMRCLAEMNRLQDRPLAMLVETRPNVILRQESILSRMGFHTEVVGSVVELEKSISRGGDLRLVLSKTQLWDLPPVEMIDRVRRLPFGKEVPIVFFGKEAPGIDTDRWNGLSEFIERPGSPSAFANFLLDLDLVRRLPELSEIDRQQFRQGATDFLATRSK